MVNIVVLTFHWNTSVLASLRRRLCWWWTTARRGRFAATDAKPTCVPTCSSLTGAVASSAASAAVLMKVQWSISTLVLSFELHFRIPSCLSHRSAGDLLPTPGPHGPQGGLLREAWALPGVLRVCGHPGLLQGTLKSKCTAPLIWWTATIDCWVKAKQKDHKLRPLLMLISWTSHGCIIPDLQFGSGSFKALQQQIPWVRTRVRGYSLIGCVLTCLEVMALTLPNTFSGRALGEQL